MLSKRFRFHLPLSIPPNGGAQLREIQLGTGQGHSGGRRCSIRLPSLDTPLADTPSTDPLSFFDLECQTSVCLEAIDQRLS